MAPAERAGRGAPIAARPLCYKPRRSGRVRASAQATVLDDIPATASSERG